MAPRSRLRRLPVSGRTDPHTRSRLAGSPLTRLAGIALAVLIASPVCAQGFDKAVYYDEHAATNWVSRTSAKALRDYLASQDYRVVNAVELKSFMTDHFKGDPPSVIVMSSDLAPDTIAELTDKAPSAISTVNSYLKAGGRIVHLGDAPFWVIAATSGGDNTLLGPAGSAAYLGVPSENVGWDLKQTIVITDDGKRRGLTQTWPSLRPAPPGKVDETLAVDAAGNSAGWVKKFGTRGEFIRLHDWIVGDTLANAPEILRDLRRVAEYGLAPTPVVVPPTSSKGGLFVRSGSAPPGGVAVVDLALDESTTDVAALKFTLDYGPDLSLTDEGISSGGIYKRPLIEAFFAPPGKVTIGVASTSSAKGPGAAVRLMFSIPLNVKPGVVIPLRLSGAEGYDHAANPIGLTLADGSIRVLDAVAGDLNGDGRVDLRDAVLALRIGVGLLAPTPLQTAVGDLSSNGKLDLRDATLILRQAIGL